MSVLFFRLVAFITKLKKQRLGDKKYEKRQLKEKKEFEKRRLEKKKISKRLFLSIIELSK